MPPNHLKANMLSQVHETCHQGCGLILVKSFTEGNSRFHCHLVITWIFPIWIMPRSLHSCFTCAQHNKLVISIIPLLQMWRRNSKWNAVVSKHFYSLADSNQEVISIKPMGQRYLSPTTHCWGKHSQEVLWCPVWGPSEQFEKQNKTWVLNLDKPNVQTWLWIRWCII